MNMTKTLPSVVIQSRDELLGWVGIQIREWPVSRFECQHCGHMESVREIAELMTECIVNHTERPVWGGDWSEFLHRISVVDDLYDLVTG